MKAVIFDIGGVLAQDVWEKLLPHMASIHSLDVKLVRKVGKRLWEAFAYVPETPQNDWRQLEQRYWRLFIRFFWGKVPPREVTVDGFIELTASFIEPIPDMEPVLERLQSQGIGLAICSNNNEFWFRRQWDKMGLQRYFAPDRTILSCRVGVSKSSCGLEMFRAAAMSLNLQPSQCAFVDDRQSNLVQANKLGMHGLWFKNAAQIDDQLRSAGF